MEIIIRLKLREIMEQKGMTQTELSKRTGIRQATISELCNNTRNILNKRHITAIMKEFGIRDLNDIMEVIIIE